MPGKVILLGKILIPHLSKEKEALGLQMQNPYLIKGQGLLKVKVSKSILRIGYTSSKAIEAFLRTLRQRLR